MYKNGAWEHVIVDDRFPVEANVFLDSTDGKLYSGRPTKRGDFFKPAFVSGKDNKIWMMIVEKAYVTSTLALAWVTWGGGDE